VRLASDADSFAKAVEEALAHPPSDDQRATWRAVALKYSWGAQVDTIEQTLAPLLEARA
ncbi:MAG: hypothetical protein H5T70_10165, partial [Chloroflexi bacterium]|nr:hypothetical protein [Chloroflexota bacterium]